MTHAIASALISDDVALATDETAMTFIQDIEYEFVGGGTAVNSD